MSVLKPSTFNTTRFIKYCAALVALIATFTAAETQALSCIARDNVPCVSFHFDPIPPGLPASLHTLADKWLRSDIAQEGRVFNSVEEFHTHIENEWRQVYPQGGNGTGSPWSVNRMFLIGHSDVPGHWASLLMIQRYYFGGAHGNYRVISKTITEKGTPVTWTDLLNRSTHDVETFIRKQLAKRYPNHNFDKEQLLPPDAWRVTANSLEIWWDPYRIGPFSMEYEGPPRVQLRWESILREAPA